MSPFVKDVAKTSIIFWSILIMLSFGALLADLCGDIPITPEYLVAIVLTGLVLNSISVALIYYVKK